MVLFCVCAVLSASLSGNHLFAWCRREPERVLNHLQLGLQLVMSHQVGAETLTWVL